MKGIEPIHDKKEPANPIIYSGKQIEHQLLFGRVWLCDQFLMSLLDCNEYKKEKKKSLYILDKACPFVLSATQLCDMIVLNWK